MKYAIVIMGGAVDRPSEALGGKTPLQAARAPTLARMGQTGRMGRAVMLPDNIEPGADAATMALLGYDPAKRYPGRAPFTAAGLNIDMPKDAWAMHLSLVAAPEGKLLAYDDQVVSPAEAQSIIHELLPTIDLPGSVVHPGRGAMHVLVDLAKDQADPSAYRDWQPVVSAPPSVALNRSIRDCLPVGEAQGERLQSLIAQSEVALREHEINIARQEMDEPAVTHLWPWGLGAMPELRPWSSRFNMSAAVLSVDPSVLGLAKLAGLDAIEPIAADSIKGELIHMSADAIEALNMYDLVIIHTDAAARAGLDGNIADKVHAIHLIDEHVLKPISQNLAAKGEHRLMTTPLYSTPADDRCDEITPVPFVITGYKMAGVVERPCTEAAAEACDLRVDYGHELMEFFLKSGVRG